MGDSVPVSCGDVAPIGTECHSQDFSWIAEVGDRLFGRYVEYLRRLFATDSQKRPIATKRCCEHPVNCIALSADLSIASVDNPRTRVPPCSPNNVTPVRTDGHAHD